MPLPWMVSLTLEWQYGIRGLNHPPFLSLYRHIRKPGSSPCSFSLWVAARRSLEGQVQVRVNRGNLKGMGSPWS